MVYTDGLSAFLSNQDRRHSARYFDAIEVQRSLLFGAMNTCGNVLVFPDEENAFPRFDLGIGRGRLIHCSFHTVESVQFCSGKDSVTPILNFDALAREEIDSDATFFAFDAAAEPRRLLKFLRLLQRTTAPSWVSYITFQNSRYHHRISSDILGLDSTGRKTTGSAFKREIDEAIEVAGLRVTARSEVRGSGFWDWLRKGASLSLQFANFAITADSVEEAREFFVERYFYRLEPPRLMNQASVCVIVVVHRLEGLSQPCMNSILKCGKIVSQIVVVCSDGSPGHYDVPAGPGRQPTFCRRFGELSGIVACSQAVVLTDRICVSAELLGCLLEPLRSRDDRRLITLLETAGSAPRAERGDFNRNEACVTGKSTAPSEIATALATRDVDCLLSSFAKLPSALPSEMAFRETLNDFKESGFEIKIIKAPQEILPDGGQVSGWRSSIKSQLEIDDLASQVNGDLSQNRIRLSVCMIVRNNEDIIERCLAGVAPIADELIVVDTGSTDRTPDICKNFGARVFHFPWCDDFSAARNFSLDHASGDWVFWIDSDDVLFPEHAQRIRRLVDSNHDSNCLGFVMKVHCVGTNSLRRTVVDHIRLFRNRQDLRFEFRIHEQILGSIRRAGGNVEFTDIQVIHRGSNDGIGRGEDKLTRDLRILELELQERPGHPFALFNMGMTLEDAGRYGEAAHWIEKCILNSDPNESHVPKAYSLWLSCLCHGEREDEAMRICELALARFPEDAELRFRRAVLLQNQNRYGEAEREYELVLGLSQQFKFRSFDPTICGGKTHHNLGLIYLDTGQWEKAAFQLEQAIRELPTFGPTWVALGKALSRRGDLQKFRSFECRLNELNEVPFAARAIFKSLLDELNGNIPEAISALRLAWERSGESECLHELARMGVTHGHFESAFAALTILKLHDPENASVLFNLGSVAQQLGKLELAQTVLQAACELQPDVEHFRRACTEIMKIRGDTQESMGPSQTPLRSR